MKNILSLFSNFKNKTARNSNAVILDAVDQVVDGTEPKIRLVYGYRKKLQDAVSRSLAYIDQLVESIPEPIEVSRKTFISNPQVNAYFSSIEDLHEIFSRSSELRAFFDGLSDSRIDEAYAMLCMKMSEKRVLGVDVNNSMIRRDVIKTAVNFSEREIISPAKSEADIREGLKHCIFDGLITYALQGISSMKLQKTELEDQRRILHARLRHRLSQGSGMNALLATAYGNQVEESDLAEVETQLADAEKQLKEMPVTHNAPLAYLNEVKRILEHPETFLKQKIITMQLTRMGIKVPGECKEACNTIQIVELDIANVLKRVVTIVRYPRDEMLS